MGDAGEEADSRIPSTTTTGTSSNGSHSTSENNIKSAQPAKKRVYFIGDNSIHVPRNDMEIKNPMTDGIVSDWDAMENIWSHIFDKTLRVDCHEHPLLITEQIWNTRENREKAMELAFEKFEFPAFYIIKSPIASLFASGKGSGLVVDVGHSVASVTPVIDGLPLYKPSRRSRFAGSYLSRQVRHLIEAKQGLPINPRYLVTKRQTVGVGVAAHFERKSFGTKNITESYHNQEQLRIVDEFKEAMCQLSDTPFTADMADSAVRRIFEFPDGSSHEYGVERFQTAEALLRPKDHALPEQPLENEPEIEYEQPEIITDGKPSEAIAAANALANANAAANATTNANSNDNSAPAVAATVEPTPAFMLVDSRPIPQFSNTLGLSQLIVDSINACDVDIRANLANNIVITGGLSLVQGLTDRVNSDLSQALAGVKIRIYAPGNTIERNFSPWIGGSVLASLGTFHQLWVSKKEYEEVGATKLLERRFR